MNETNKVILRLDGAIKAETYLDAMKNFVELIERVADNATGEKNSVIWFVEVQQGSINTIYTAQPKNIPPEKLPIIFTALNEGINSLESGNAKPPKYFDEKAMGSFKEISEITSEVIVEVKVGVNTKKISKRSAASVDLILGPSYSDYGTLEGRIKSLFSNDGYKFTLFDDLTNRAIQCRFNSNLRDVVHGSWEKRAMVSGEITYRQDGIPLRIKADHIRVFRDDDKLPTIDEIVGIFQ